VAKKSPTRPSPKVVKAAPANAAKSAPGALAQGANPALVKALRDVLTMPGVSQVFASRLRHRAQQGSR
jgi:hypothetical protein